ncbi:MAG: hypothetical protein ACRC2V_19680 [Xenococcaceae cyanobacterium]
MENYQTLKIPIFPTINDLPTAPTANAPGNGSHLIAKHNELVDAIARDLNALQPSEKNHLFSAILAYGFSS